MGGVDIWLILGTRRWARLMASELCKLLPQDTAIYLQGSMEESEFRSWYNATPFKMGLLLSNSVQSVLL
jgi:hypothetical protein